MISDEACKPFETPYREARLHKVVDGDTLDLLIDLGFDVHKRARVRLITLRLEGVDAWEIKGEDSAKGKEARARVMDLLAPGTTVRIRSVRGEGSTDKYGRWLASILFMHDGKWTSLGDVLLAEGHARPWRGQ